MLRLLQCAQGDDTSRDNLKGATAVLPTVFWRHPTPDAVRAGTAGVSRISRMISGAVIARLFSRFTPNRDTIFAARQTGFGCDARTVLSAFGRCAVCSCSPGERRIRDSWQWTVRSMASRHPDYRV